MAEEVQCPPAPRRLTSSRLLVTILLIVIAANELQRTWAQSEAHRQRVELAITMAELSRKVDWLLLITRPPTSSLPVQPPPGAVGSLAPRR